MVGKSLDLMKSLKTPPSPGAAVSTLGVMGNLCKATTTAAKASAASNATSGPGGRRLYGEAGSGEGGSGSGEDNSTYVAPRSAEALQFETLRASIGSLGDATLKGSLDGEEPVTVVSKSVQSSAARASGASLAGQKFGAAKGPTGISLPAGLSTGGSVAVKIAVIDKSINTYAADSSTKPETAMVSIKMTDDSGENVAKKGAVGDADPLVILVPVEKMDDPLPCNPGAAGKPEP